MFRKTRRRLKHLLRLRTKRCDYRHRAVAHHYLSPEWVARVELYSDDPNATVKITDTEFDPVTRDRDIECDFHGRGDMMCRKSIVRIEGVPEEMKHER